MLFVSLLFVELINSHIARMDGCVYEEFVYAVH